MEPTPHSWEIREHDPSPLTIRLDLCPKGVQRCIKRLVGDITETPDKKTCKKLKSKHSPLRAGRNTLRKESLEWLTGSGSGPETVFGKEMQIYSGKEMAPWEESRVHHSWKQCFNDKDFGQAELDEIFTDDWIYYDRENAAETVWVQC